MNNKSLFMKNEKIVFTIILMFIKKQIIVIIDFCCIVASSSMSKIGVNVRWTPNGITVAGGNGKGNGLEQLNYPWGIYIDDDDQTIYIADTYNARVVEWKYGSASGQVVAGGNGNGNRADQLYDPRDVIVDKKSDSLIISDMGSGRVVRWPRRNGTTGQTIISDVCCYGLAMDNDGYLYISDYLKHEVRQWRIGDTSGTLVAGGNGKGDRLDQLNGPIYIFVDQDHSVFITDENNHRVMKWMNGAKEGIIVAGGQGKGNSLSQLSGPRGVIVDQFGSVYVADYPNNRVMRWCKGAKQGSVVVGENGRGGQPNQFHYPQDLSFDRQGNLYVADMANQRIQKFNIDQS
jgi:sugar lactone lactonase YvrE